MTITACNPACDAPNWSEDETWKWCSFPVELPHNHWAELAGRKEDPDKRVVAALQNIEVWVVDQEEDVKPAMEALYQSMRDPIIGIDTEWKYDGKQTDNDIALISLASSSCIVLLRTCFFHGIPKVVREFCRDDEIVGVGFAWDVSDEKKLQSSFGIGRKDLFRHFVDIKPLSGVLGYHDVSINSLSRKVLEFELPKSQHITLSNWEDSFLTARQVRYAALDSLVAADVFRGLRVYHAEPQECSKCNLKLGMWPGNLDLSCAAPECKRKKRFASITALLSHASSTGHPSYVTKCQMCYRVSGPTMDDAQAIERQAERDRQPEPPPPTRKPPQISLQQETLEELLEQGLLLGGEEAKSQAQKGNPARQYKQRQNNMPSARSKKKKEHSMYAAYASYLA